MSTGFPSIVRAMALGVAIALACLGCSSESTQPRTGFIPALALKASPAAYALFQKDLDHLKADNDFTKRAKDPENYDVYVTETSDEYLYSFSMRPLKGERILDGRSVYAVNKKDGVATLRSML